MIGGGLKIQKMFKTGDTDTMISLFVMTGAILLLRTYIVQITYNMMWPKVVMNSGGDTSRFTPLTFYESLMMVILFSFLFGY
jgi:hypothetical protein